MESIINQNLKTAKPFLKWAGGKTKLLEQFSRYFPRELNEGKIQYYYEPFLGGGAVFFYIAQNFPIKKAYLSDINEDLILTFRVVQENVYELIEDLEKLKKNYLNKDENKRKDYYYKIRTLFNDERRNINFENYSKKWIPRAAKLIFLNKTCFNGLFRLNSRGEFNVPFGRYKNPSFYDKENLINVSNILQIAEIFITDFENIKKNIKNGFFIYFDPPYRPISDTASFTSYSKNNFTDQDQIRLANLFVEFGYNGNKVMLSNSDPKNENPSDNFFEELYKNFNVFRIRANRMINCNSDKRGKINELLITNYEIQ